ncbi:hypothetical protein KC19_6G220800 [Ceratodon purpureus]|nr:hypothetical protein KC19_6G220800 [Ceratodon purpureus]
MSFLSLVRPGEAIYFNCICGIYEAWVIYNFLSLCIAFIGGPGAVATNLQGRYLKPSWHLMTCCCDAIPLDGVFIRRCKRGVLQFVILKPLLVGATLLLYESGMYEDGSFSITSGYLYITIVYTFSYTLALAALVLFYVACKDMLQPFQPLPKFLIIKSIVFLTYWQGVLIALLANGGVIKTAQGALDAQNITICVEMLFAAIGHLHAFPYKVYTDANINGRAGSLWHSILHALNFSDLVYDTMHQFAPTYHEYVLYSDGSQEAPQRYRVRTFVPTEQVEQGHELKVVRNSMSTPCQPALKYIEPGGAAAATTSNEVPRTTPAPADISAAASDVRTAPLPTFGQIVTSFADNRASQSHAKPPLGASASKKSFFDNDFNPRASLPGPDARRAALLQHDFPAAPYRQWGKSFEGAPRRSDARRESSSEDEVITELTKLTDRRASEHGPLMDTIDLRGENEEYSEGFIQR